MSEVRRPTEPELQEHADAVRATATELEPAVHDLATALRSLGRDLARATADDENRLARWESVGWNAATDMTDLLAGHLVSAVQGRPTQRRYVELCERFGVEPVRIETNGSAPADAPAWVDVDALVPVATQARWLELAAVAAEMEPLIRELLDGHAAADVEFDQLTKGVSDGLCASLHEWTGKESLNDNLAVIVGHVERGTSDRPTGNYYVHLCEARGITPYDPAYDPDETLLRLTGENIALKQRVAELGGAES